MKLKIDGEGRHLDQWYARCSEDHQHLAQLIGKLPWRYQVKQVYAAMAQYQARYSELEERLAKIEEEQWRLAALYVGQDPDARLVPPPADAGYDGLTPPLPGL